MAAKKYTWRLKGMMTDPDEAIFSQEFASYIKNLRLVANEDGFETMSLTTEEGETSVAKMTAPGEVIGCVAIGKIGVVFKHFANASRNIDTVTVVFRDSSGNFDSKNLFIGPANFDADHPIEALGYVEADDLWKVYWSDNYNQPRMLAFNPQNLAGYVAITDVDLLNFSPKIDYKTINVERVDGGNGTFVPGTIQYTYRVYRKNGQASGLIDLSPLFTIAGAPNEVVNATFKVTIPSNTLDSIEVYSIHRSAPNAQPEVKKLYSGTTGGNDVIIVDNGAIGEIVQPETPLFFTSVPVTCQTIEQKDGRMFYGGCKKIVTPPAKDYFRCTTEMPQITSSSFVAGTAIEDGAIYPSTVTYRPYFKKGETYRLGVQLMDRYGNWSDVYWMCDKMMSQGFSDLETQSYSAPSWSVVFGGGSGQIRIPDGYVAARPMIVYPTESDRTIVCQGVASPTITDKLYAPNGSTSSSIMSSWIFRPKCDNAEYKVAYEDGGSTEREVYSGIYRVNRKYASINSPDIEFGGVMLDGSYNIKIVGSAREYATSQYRNVETSSIPYSVFGSAGFKNEPYVKPYQISEGVDDGSTKTMWNYRDTKVSTDDRKGDLMDYTVRLFQNDGSISERTANDIVYAKLLKNRTAYLRSCLGTRYNGEENLGNRTVRTINDDLNTYKVGSARYSGGVNTSVVNNGKSTQVSYRSTRHAVAELGSPLPYYNDGEFSIVEISRSVVNNRFGGTSDAALLNNRWEVAGNAMPVINGATTLIWDRGDTYMARYDCLKTYAYSDDSTNQVVDILSFMVETRVNLDARYDKHIGAADNIGMNPSVFNLINKNCSNLATYHSGISHIDDDSSAYSTTVSWSLPKENGSDIDPWTNITMAASLSLDGQYGELTKIKKFNNQLLTFQPKSVARLNYNDRVMLNPTDGVPIVIANQTTVDGYTTLSSFIGCSNKWTVTESPSALYFIDDGNKAAYSFNGQGFTNVGQAHGMSSFFKSTKVNKCVYDPVYSDVCYLTDGDALCFNEQLGNFTGVFTMPDGFGYMYVDGAMLHADGYDVYQLHKGDYDVDQVLEVVIHSEGPIATDKIYDNVEWVADCYVDGEYVSDETFDKIEAETNYQRGATEFTDCAFKRIVNALKKKFNIWRANVPRDSKNKQAGRIQDRMRGTWAKIKLTKYAQPGHKLKLHNIFLDYFE